LSIVCFFKESGKPDDVETCVDENHLISDHAGEIGGQPDRRTPNVIDGDVVLKGGDGGELAIHALEAAHTG